jgi:hypothetical protein
MALKRFSSRLERLSRGFLDSRLNSAIAYDRIAGYFRSSVFEIAGEAFDKIDGPIRIVCNSGLDVRDVDVARALFNDWCESAPERMTERQRPRYERLATLLRAQRVEIRVLPDASFGLIHGKAGVIRYRDGSSTCFLGSINETGEAWTLHYELLWEDENAVSVAWVQAEFDALWSHRDARPLAAVVVEMWSASSNDASSRLQNGIRRRRRRHLSSRRRPRGKGLVSPRINGPLSLAWSTRSTPLVRHG